MSEWYNDHEQETTQGTSETTQPFEASPMPSQESVTPPANSTINGDVTPWLGTPPEQQPASVSQQPAAPVQAPQEMPAQEINTPPTATPYGAPQQPYAPRSQFAPQQNVQQPYTPPYVNTNHAVAPQQPKKKVSGSHIAIALLSVLCCVSLLLSGVMAFKLLGSDGTDNTPGTTQTPSGNGGDEDDDRVINDNAPSLQITDTEAINDGGLATSEIVDRNLDATVVLTMYTRTSNSFYGYYYGEESDSLTEAGGASGIIMSEDGYIITNSHCVYDEDAQAEFDRIDVTLYDGRVFEGAEIVGYDPTTDLAVIKIDATDLTPAEFGDSSALSLGDRVITLGNSGGLAWTVSQGILSGQARDVYEDTGYAIKCLQVDAIINPGSSGGPLINAYGQVVGVNSAKIVLTGYEGLGFSIPINEAKAVIDDLIKYGYVTGRVSLGIMGRTITSIGYEGFMIESINNDSAFVGTKAQAGDIITHVDGVRVTDYTEMRAELTSHEVGDTVTLTLLRLDRQTRTTQEFDVSVVLQESR